MRRVMALVLLALGCVLVTAAPASACDEPTQSFRKQLRAAELVFDGRVTQVVGRADSDDRIVYVVKVRRVYAGRAATETTVTSPAKNADCGLQDVRNGQRYVFLTGTTESGVVQAFSNEGTRRGRPAVLETVTDVLGRGEDPVAPSALEAEEDQGPGLTRVDDSEPPDLAVTALPGAAIAVLGLLVLVIARTLGRARP